MGEVDALGPQSQPWASVVPVTAGLASLTVDMPIRGKAFYFTTPRGEVTITARSLSQAAIATLEHAGVVVAALILSGIIYRFALRPRPQRRDATIAATLLIVLGLASVAMGLLPVLGLAAFLFGLVLKVVRRRPKSAAAHG